MQTVKCKRYKTKTRKFDHAICLKNTQHVPAICATTPASSIDRAPINYHNPETMISKSANHNRRCMTCCAHKRLSRNGCAETAAQKRLRRSGCAETAARKRLCTNIAADRSVCMRKQNYDAHPRTIHPAISDSLRWKHCQTKYNAYNTGGHQCR